MKPRKTPSKEISRRKFVKTTAAAAVGTTALATGCKQAVSVPNIISNKTFEWRMVLFWGKGSKVLGEGAQNLATWIETMSQGRLRIKVYGANERVPAGGVFEAVGQGDAELGHCASYYWAGDVKAAQFFAAVPFGMNAQQMNAWIYHGGGQALWDEVYEPFGVMGVPAGNTGVQMGGWFNREINAISDFKGLKMRMPGIGGAVLNRAGAEVVNKPPGELYSSLETGLIDATEWVGPYHDYLMGFHEVAKYYYYPGWHEPGTVLELIINRKAFEALPADLQEIIRTAAFRANLSVLSELEAKNNDHLKILVDQHKVDLRRFPDEVLKQLKVYSRETIDDLCSGDPQSRKVYDAFSAFQKTVNAWGAASERVMHELDDI